MSNSASSSLQEHLYCWHDLHSSYLMQKCLVLCQNLTYIPSLYTDREWEYIWLPWLWCYVFVTSSVMLFLLDFQSVFLLFLLRKYPLFSTFFCRRNSFIHSCTNRTGTSADWEVQSNQPAKGLTVNLVETKAAMVPKDFSMRPNSMQLNCLCCACQLRTKADPFILYSC